jgi:pimeloyl-ACP methyl ester carboxylesterase
MVAQDLPAALAAVRLASGASRVLWVGHGLGGQALLVHLARGGAADLAGAAVLGAAAAFPSASSRARLLGLAARMLPANLRLPVRRMAQMSAAGGASIADVGLGRDLEGPRARGLLLDGAEDIGMGFVAQAARWMESGTLCDRLDRIDYVAALDGVTCPVFGVSARGDRVCAPEQLAAALDRLDPVGVERLTLDESWSHLDLLVGRRAAQTVAPAVVEFFAAHRGDVHRPRGPAADGWGGS